MGFTRKRSFAYNLKNKTLLATSYLIVRAIFDISI